jgi:hypothetical protein
VPKNVLFAIEGEFLCDDLYGAVNFDKICIFARVSPEGKTGVIRGMK